MTGVRWMVSVQMWNSSVMVDVYLNVGCFVVLCGEIIDVTDTKVVDPPAWEEDRGSVNSGDWTTASLTGGAFNAYQRHNTGKEMGTSISF